jgi:hypothetical protein
MTTITGLTANHRDAVGVMERTAVAIRNGKARGRGHDDLDERDR